jgi:uncharacterized membrane protein
MTFCRRISSAWMTSTTESLLARMLSYGTWISTGIIFIGLSMEFAMRALKVNPVTTTGAGSAMHVVSGGIAILILLPPLRVIFMLGAFVRKRDYRFAAFAAIVLTIIFVGLALGIQTARSG